MIFFMFFFNFLQFYFIKYIYIKFINECIRYIKFHKQITRNKKFLMPQAYL